MTRNYLIPYQHISIHVEGEKGNLKKKKISVSSLEDGLAYTSFPVQQRWNLKMLLY